MKANIWLKSTLFVLFITLLLTRPALAGYIDPNTGGMLFQVLAVAFALVSGLVLFFASQIRMALARLRRFVRSRLGKSKEQATAE